jgi:hypothetical protein
MPILHRIVIAAGILLLGAGAWLAFIGAEPSAAIAPIVLGIMLTIGVIYERRHYKTIGEGNPGPGWEETSERFVDPESGQLVAVYYKPATGERKYVRVGAAGR